MTPLIYSTPLSARLNADVYLKLENTHPCHSFKLRGISHFIASAKVRHGPHIHCIVASGGNAGLAAAYAARQLDLACTVYIPQGVSQPTMQFLDSQGAHVVVTGSLYADALLAAQQALQLDPSAIMIPAYDHQDLWYGHSSMVDEIAHQLSTKPDAIFCSVGGGGLLGGIIIGCARHQWDDVPIVAMETLGSNCFHYSLLLSQQSQSDFANHLPPGVTTVTDDATPGLIFAHFSSFSSLASGSLGASRPSAGVLQMALQRKGQVKCVSVDDYLSMQAAIWFADDHKFLVELACSTTLVAGYKAALFDTLVPLQARKANIKRVVVFIVCGGFKISLQDLDKYETLVRGGAGDAWGAVYEDGVRLNVGK